MKYYKLKSAAIFLAFAFFLSACGGGDEDPFEESALELESAKAALFFYGAATNNHLAFETQTQELINLNDNDEYAEFNMSNKPAGRLFVWVDDKGDDNASNDEDKVIMFNAEYSYIDDGNATWEDFFYLGHFHEEVHEDEEHEGDEHEEHSEHLAAHTNDEFDVSSETNQTIIDSKTAALARLNNYMQMQEILKADLSSALTNEDATAQVCNFYGVYHEEENATDYFVVGTNGRFYAFHDEGDGLEFKDDTLLSSAGCEEYESGISATADGALVYLKKTATLYLVDSHGDARTHVHSSWGISQLLGDGVGVDMMVGIKTIENEGEAHAH